MTIPIKLDKPPIDCKQCDRHGVCKVGDLKECPLRMMKELFDELYEEEEDHGDL